MKTKTRRFTSALFCAMAIAITTLACFMPVECLGQGSVDIHAYMSAGPNSGSVGYSGFLSDFDNAMINESMYGSSVLIPNNGITSVTNVFSSSGNIGNRLYAGGVITDSSMFTVSQCSYLFASPYFSNNNTLANFSFSQGTIGILWGPGGPGTGDTVYTSGSASGVQLNELVFISNAYTFMVNSGDTVDQSINSFIQSFGTQLPISVTYYLGGQSGSTTAIVTAPEPATFTMFALGGIGFIILKKKQK